MLRIWIKLLSILIIIISIALANKINIYQLTTNETPINELNPIVNKPKITLSNDHIGTIKIPKLNISNYISSNAKEKTLNKNIVGLYSHNNLDIAKGNIILAGHNNKKVFSTLNNIKLNDIIEINSINTNYKYKVINKMIINPDNFVYFKEIFTKKIITLVTCINNNNKRLIIVAQLL